jgi:acetyltransferase-like isoleucine patch superfamily enzyme
MVDDSRLSISPFYSSGGRDISVGWNVFSNQNCTLYDLGGLDIADDVMIGPSMSIKCDKKAKRRSTWGKR